MGYSKVQYKKIAKIPLLLGRRLASTLPDLKKKDRKLSNEL
jgi:hypothetical protein